MQFNMDKTDLMQNIELKKLENKFIMHSGVDSIIKTIMESIESKALLREMNEVLLPESICLIGESGAGKTAICEAIKLLYPPTTFSDSLSETEQQPIIDLSVPAGTLKGLTNKILRKLGDINPNKGDTQERTDRIIQLLETTKTNLIILDEFHNLIAGKNHAVIVKWVKTLINETKIPVMVVGTPEVRNLITESSEVSRRFKILNIEPFNYQFTANNFDFEVYVNTYARLLTDIYPKISYSEITEPFSLMRLYLATVGNVGNINGVMINSFICAKDNGNDNVSRADLSEGYLKTKIVHVSRFHSRNPFEMNDKDAVGLLNKVLSKPR